MKNSYHSFSRFAFVKRPLQIILLSLIALVCVYCAPTLEKFNSLANQGILPLSTENPHIGANLLLAHEAEQSGYLMNFLTKRGGPTAIEVITEGRTNPTMVLFYPLKKEVFAADLSRENETYQWIIRGPFMMERQDYRELSSMGVAFAGEPVFMIRSKLVRFGLKPVISDDRALLPIVPTPRPTATRRPVRKVISAPAEPTATPFRPMNSDQRALATAQGFAERNDDGDLIHVVGSENEKLEQIVKWYTGSPSNTALVALKNKISTDTAITIGQRIVIPFAVIKQFKAYKGS